MTPRQLFLQSTIRSLLAAMFFAAISPRISAQSPAAPADAASEKLAPLLLDPSMRIVGQAAVPREAPAGREASIVPKLGPMNVSLDVLVNGRPLSTIRHAGKTYLPVPCVGEEYQIRIWNHGPRRIVAVVSVDGLSVISGQPASENDAGYVVSPYSHVVVKGWRRNLDQVAAFRFVDREKSYGTLIGRPDNIGVIGLVAFEEQIVHPLPMLERRDAAAPAKSFRTEVGSIGTEYGRDTDSRAYYVEFLRSTNRQTITMYYDTTEALRAAGVPVDRPMPIPFPRDVRFAPPPPRVPAP
ncbi:MAG: hypothetical protein U0744_20315 [Gemmataceae bacterium]